MTTEIDTSRVADKSRDEALRQLLARGGAKEGAALEDAAPPVPTGLQARAVAEGRFSGPDAVNHKAAVMLSLQRSHGNAYVQRLVSRSVSPRIAQTLTRPAAPPPLQLQPDEEEPSVTLAAPEQSAGFAPPEAPPPPSNGGPPATPSGPPESPPSPPLSDAAAAESPGVPADSGSPSPPPAAPATPAAGNGAGGIARITSVEDLKAAEAAESAGGIFAEVLGGAAGAAGGLLGGAAGAIGEAAGGAAGAGGGAAAGNLAGAGAAAGGAAGGAVGNLAGAGAAAGAAGAAGGAAAGNLAGAGAAAGAAGAAGGAAAGNLAGAGAAAGAAGAAGQAAPGNLKPAEPAAVPGLNPPSGAGGGASATPRVAGGGGSATPRARGGGAPSRPAGGGAGTGGGQPGGGATPPVPAPQITPPTPTNPASGVDWDAFLAQFGDPLNIARTFLEVTRPIPIAGLFTGMAADAINTYQDLDSISKEDAPFTTGAIVFRDVVMIINNVLGSLSSLDQWVQDAATGSVVFVEADAVTAPVQEALKTAKLVCDGIQLSLDVIIAASAQYNASKATTPESAARWNGLLQNYQANILGDTLTTVIDVIDVASAGAGNAENAKQAATGIKNMVPASKVIKQVIFSVLQGWFGIYGGGLMPGAQKPPTLPASGPGAAPGAGGGPAIPGVPGVPIPYPNLPGGGGDDAVTRALGMAARQTASAVIRGEIGQMKSVYTTVDVALGVGADVLSQMMTDQRERLKALLGGQDPLRLFVTAVSQGLNNLNNEVTQLLQMGVLASDAQERATAIIQYSDQAQSAVDSIRMPRIQVPHAGGGGLLDAAADLFQTQVVDRLTAQAQRMIDDVKLRASRPIAVVKGNAQEIADFSIVLQQTATSTVTAIQARIASFTAAFARCNSLEDIINVIISQTFQALGLGEGFTVDDVIQEWRAIGPALDDADDWAASLANPGPNDEQ